MKSDELKLLVTQGETEHVEFKASLSLLDRGAKSITAMTNSCGGGVVIFGLHDDGTPSKTFEIAKDSEEKIGNYIVQRTISITNAIPLTPRIRTYTDLNLIVVSTNSKHSSKGPYLLEDKLYERAGRSDRKVKMNFTNLLQLTKEMAEKRGFCPRCGSQGLIEEQVIISRGSSRKVNICSEEFCNWRKFT